MPRDARSKPSRPRWRNSVSIALSQAFALLLEFTGEVSISLVLGNIPVAADSLQSLSRIGSPLALRTKAMVSGSYHWGSERSYSVWASPELKDYRSGWDEAATAGFVDAATEWGDNVDIDHVFPKSWANLPGSNVKYVRLFPVWAEINRSAGAGREKGALKAGLSAKRKKGIVYAQELQVLKSSAIPSAPRLIPFRSSTKGEVIAELRERMQIRPLGRFWEILSIAPCIYRRCELSRCSQN